MKSQTVRAVGDVFSQTRGKALPTVLHRFLSPLSFAGRTLAQEISCQRPALVALTKRQSRPVLIVAGWIRTWRRYLFNKAGIEQDLFA
ncbi:MAG: hypothetical protein WBB25_14455 [Sulfitobacter sp.]